MVQFTLTWSFCWGFLSFVQNKPWHDSCNSLFRGHGTVKRLDLQKQMDPKNMDQKCLDPKIWVNNYWKKILDPKNPSALWALDSPFTASFLRRFSRRIRPLQDLQVSHHYTQHLPIGVPRKPTKKWWIDKSLGSRHLLNFNHQPSTRAQKKSCAILMCLGSIDLNDFDHIGWLKRITHPQNCKGFLTLICLMIFVGTWTLTKNALQMWESGFV